MTRRTALAGLLAGTLAIAAGYGSAFLPGPPPAWARRAAEAEAERLAAFTGGELELRWADA